MKHVLPFFILLCIEATAQTGSVADFQKVSEFSGNFNEDLQNIGMFGYLSETADSSILISAAPFAGNGEIHIIALDDNGAIGEINSLRAGDFDFFDELSDARFGMSVIEVPDQNGDGDPDYICGAPGVASTGGLFYLESNGENFDLLEIALPIDMENASELGSFLFNDGEHILVYSAETTGVIYQCTFNTGNLNVMGIIDENHPLLFGALENGDQFGSGLSVSDMNGDGINDVVCGAPGDDDFNTDYGAVYILYRNLDGGIDDVRKISTSEGDFNGFLNTADEFGVSVRGIGDLDQDGYADLAVGAPGDDDGGLDIGAVWIIFLRADGTVKNHRKINRLQGDFDGDIQFQDRFGIRLANLGDHNQDGTIDLAVGAVEDDDGGTNKGAFYSIFIEYCPSPSGQFNVEVENGTASFFAEGGDGYSHIWNFDDGGYSQEQNPVHVYESPGTYWVCLAINSECGGNNYCQNVVVNTVLSVEDAFDANTKVFPNPAFERFTISGLTMPTRTRLVDITGRVVLEKTLNTNRNELDIAHFSPGVYLLELQAGKEKVVKRVQIQ